MSFKSGLTDLMKRDSDILRSVKFSAPPTTVKFSWRTSSPVDSQCALIEECEGRNNISPVLKLRPMCSDMRILRLREVHPTYWLPQLGEQLYLYTTLERIPTPRESFERKKEPIVNLLDMTMVKLMW